MAVLGSHSRFVAPCFSGSIHANGFKIGTPVANQPDAWCDRVRAGIGWPGAVYTVCDRKLISIFYLSVATFV